MITRRSVVLGAAAFGAGYYAQRSPVWLPAQAQAAALPPPALPQTGNTVAVAFDVAERQVALPCFGGKALPLWTFDETLSPDAPQFPTVRIKLGDRLDVSLKNSLTRPGENLTIHWHGLRIANGQDGVAYMTQAPIPPGGQGSYSFVPPDTGTFFFHTHCNSVEHFGRGLVGILIVEGDETEKSDADIVLAMKDWRIGRDGAFLPFSTADGPAKSGTPGTVRSVNGTVKPVIKVAASADIRLRLLNVDPTRISDVGAEGAEAFIIAVDGNACVPIALESWRFGPAQRLDILMRSPAEGGTVKLLDYFAPEPIVLAEFVSEGAPKRSDAFSPRALRASRAPAADLKTAQRLTFDLGATASGEAIAALGAASGIEVGSLCLSKRTFWAINKQSWASADHSDAGPALAELKLGASYIFSFKNLSAHAHPIHIHGHTFEVLTSNLAKLSPHRADTVLVRPKETVDVAFVADNPGRWMLHCHILEHQETGMMGYITVS